MTGRMIRTTVLAASIAAASLAGWACAGDGCPEPERHERFCVLSHSSRECDFKLSYCKAGAWTCRTDWQHPPPMPEFEDWAWRCEVIGCDAQVFRDGPAPDWQEERPYTPPDPALLSVKWEMIADSDDVVPLGCEKRPVQFVWVQSFALNPQNPDVMYIGMYLSGSSGIEHTSGVYKSVDGGRTWFTAWAGLGGYAVDAQGQTLTDECPLCQYGVSVRELYVDPADPQVVFASTDERGLYRTEDGGQHWTAVRFNDSRMRLHPGQVRRAQNGFLYHANSNELLRSADGGQSWEHVADVSQNRIIDTLLPDPVLPDRLWLGGGWPILVSDDAGQTWRRLGHDFLLHPSEGWNVRDLAICRSNPSRMAAAVEGGGIYLSQDFGETWTKADMLEDGNWGHAVAYAPLADRCLLYATELEHASTWWTENDGDSWVRIRTKVMEQMAFNPYVPEIVYAITYFGTYNVRSFELWTRCYHRPE